MKIKRIHLENFRNIKAAQIPLDLSSQFLLGANGQGKTNLIEAISLVSALRSFRSSNLSQCICNSTEYAQIYYEIDHEHLGHTEITLQLHNKQKNLWVDGNKVKSIGDILGQYPSVVLSSEDIQLIRSSPTLRRRYIDLLLSSLDREYFETLMRFYRALKGRNALLKKATGDAAQLTSFEKILSETAAQIVLKRKQQVHAFNPVFVKHYQHISNNDEQAEFQYAAYHDSTEPEAWQALYEQDRPLDILKKHTQTGPHRDDYIFLLNGYPAKDFASEGQQRSLVMSLKLASIERIQQTHNTRPIILADDILGELDTQRRDGFWRTINRDYQVIATGTQAPQENIQRQWHTLHVVKGEFRTPTKPEHAPKGDES